jgi:diacylglycerol kinase
MHIKVTETNNRNTDNRSGFIKSAGYAFNGIKQFFKSERNGRIQAVIAVVVILSGILFSISMIEWLIVILFIALVLSMEMLNSALEKLSDKVNPNTDPEIKLIKDMAAGAVLWCAFISAIAGLIIFVPKIIEIL